MNSKTSTTHQRSESPYSFERRPEGLVVGWHPTVSRVRALVAVRRSGGEGSDFFVLKRNALREQTSGETALPIEIVESPKKVDLVRLDTEKETVTWERRPGGPGVIRVFSPYELIGNKNSVLPDLLSETTSPERAESVLDQLKTMASPS